MLVLIDDARIEEIENLYDKYPYDGVTTNPSILKAAGHSPIEQLKMIRRILPPTSQLHVQVVSDQTDRMIQEAQFLMDHIGENIYIKVPVTEPGLRAIPRLVQQGIKVTATAIYTAMQAFMAAKAGASYAAPYVNRLDNMGADGVRVAKTIHDIFRVQGLKAEVLAASFKNSQQILDLCQHGIGAVTAAPDVLRALTYHDATFMAEENFTNDFYMLVNSVAGTHLHP
ncbi:MAG: fructose-6-phosphate aldolase [Clostridia bacterium]|nr:fructose-6-phosphate aldolase [Clostridia bacterium]